MSDFNDRIIAEFRANDGKVGGPFEGGNLLLLHTTGAKSGAQRISPLAYLPVDDGYAIFASAAGADSHPAWYHNLLAHPQTSVEVGTDTVAVTARDLPRDERDVVWERMKQVMPGFADYEKKTSRTIPVVVLSPTSS